MGKAEVPERPRHKQGSPLVYFLAFVFCVFIGILIFTYMVTRKTHPVYTDQQGNPVNAEGSQDSSKAGSSKK